MNEFEKVFNTIGKTYWDMDYYQFLSRTGFNDDQYSMEKFQLLQNSFKGLLQFDPNTLKSILEGSLVQS